VGAIRVRRRAGLRAVGYSRWAVGIDSGERDPWERLIDQSERVEFRCGFALLLFGFLSPLFISRFVGV
jgi:hypothetical protein